MIVPLQQKVHVGEEELLYVVDGIKHGLHLQNVLSWTTPSPALLSSLRDASDEQLSFQADEVALDIPLL